MRQRLNYRCVHCKHWIKQMCKTDTLRLGDQSEEPSITIETPGAPFLNQLYSRLVVAVQELIRDPSFRCLVCELKRF
jgi:hypothetical protein